MSDESSGYEVGLTSDRSNPGLRKIKPDGQQETYLVLSAEERAKGFVMPVCREYRHLACGTKTTMGQAIAETYARNPKFYGGTFCVCCGAHFDLLKPDGSRAFQWITYRNEPVSYVGEAPLTLSSGCSMNGSEKKNAI